MSLPKILVTGFGPFPGAARNPSGLLAQKIIRSRRLRAFARIEGAIIPTVYEEILVTFPQLIETEKPDAILMFGLAGGAPCLRIETQALNFASNLYPDAARNKASQTLFADAPEKLYVRSPVERLLKAARGTGIKARLSADAGRYVCNAALFAALATAERLPKRPLAAFVHIPWPRPQRKHKNGWRDQRPTMRELERAGEAILIALASCARMKT
jgi:pyroglutamyl-peptidase